MQKADEEKLMEKLEEENERQRKLVAEKEAELVRQREEEVKQLKNYLLNQMQEMKYGERTEQDEIYLYIR